MMTAGHSIFSSKDITMTKIDEFIEDVDFYSNISGIDVEEINKRILSGSSNQLFDHNKYTEQLLLVTRSVEDLGLFVVNFKKMKISNDLKNELEVFRYKLLIWCDFCHDHGFVIYEDPTWYFLRCLREGPAFGTWLKDFFDYSIRLTLATGLFTLPDGQEAIKIKSLNDIYPPNHLIMWIQPPDYTDVTDFSFVNSKVNPTERSRIKDVLRSHCKSGFDKGLTVSKQISAINNKKIINRKGQKVFSYEGKSLFNGYPSCLVYDISHVTKSSCEGRICAIAHDDTRTLLKRGRDLSQKDIISSKWDYYGKKPWKAESMLHEKDGRSFIMYDQRKCGWTFPMEFMQDFFEVLFEETSREEYSILMDIYKNKKIFYNLCGNTLNPLRGFTLGMWDNVLSHIMSCVFQNFIEIHVPEQDLDYIKGMFFGDDAVIIIDQPETHYIDVRYYWNKYLTYLMSLGIELNTKKSFFASSGIFCEMYGDSSYIFNHKLTYYLLSGLDSLSKENTWERKVHLDAWSAQMKTYSTFLPCKELFNKFVERINSLVIINTETEFDDFDHYFPFEGGGWFRETVDGLSTFLLRCSKGEIPTRRVNLYTCKSFQDYCIGSIPNKEKKLHNQLMDMFNGELCVEHIINQIYDKKYTYYESTSTKKKMQKLKKKYSYYRKELYDMKKIYRGQLLSFIYEKGCSGQHFPIDMFTDQISEYASFVRGLKQKPHKYQEGFDLDFLESVEVFEKRSEQDIITTRDCIANIYKEISSSKYPIPIPWLKFMMSHNMTIEQLYERLVDIGLDITKVKPSNTCKKENFSDKYYPMEGDISYWDEITCCYYEITYEDTFYLAYKGEEEISEYLFNKYLREGDVEYYQFLDHFGEPHVEEEPEDYTQDLLNIESMLNPAPKEQEEIFISRTMEFDINDLHDQYGEGELYEDDDESKHSLTEFEVELRQGNFRGQYIIYLDQDHEEFDETIIQSILNKEGLDPIDYYLQIQDYPILGEFMNEAESDDDDYG